jgi:transcriptional regulator with XRE-family HTH domain
MNANALKAQMALAGMTAQALCERTGINSSSFYRKMAGKVEFTQGEISAIARELNMSKDTIFAVFFAAEVS